MITPLVSDEVWTESFARVPAWRPPAMRTVILSPHPDDETLGAGGLIKTLAEIGAEISVVSVTDGEGAYSEMPDLGPVRQQEQVDALAALGVRQDHIIHLRLPDRQVASCESILVDQLSSLADSPCHLVAPWIGDFHPDHEACGRAATQVAKLTGALLSYYFFWTWHRGEPSTLHGLNLRALRLEPATIAAKAEAIRKHRSQLHHPAGEPILSERLLAPTLWPFEMYAAA